MPKSVNGKPGATITTVLQDQNPPVPLKDLLDMSLAELKRTNAQAEIRRMSEEYRRRKAQRKTKP